MSKPNFNSIVNDLLRFSTQAQLEKDTGVDQATISRLKNGHQVKRLTYTNGDALISAHKKIKRKLQKEVADARTRHSGMGV